MTCDVLCILRIIKRKQDPMLMCNELEMNEVRNGVFESVEKSFKWKAKKGGTLLYCEATLIWVGFSHGSVVNLNSGRWVVFPEFTFDGSHNHYPP